MTTAPEESLYIIDGTSSIARFRIVRHTFEEHDMVFFNDGRATLSFKPSDAEALGRAFLAVASGLFTVAETELSVLLRKEDSARRQRLQNENRNLTPTTPSIKPELDML